MPACVVATRFWSRADHRRFSVRSLVGAGLVGSTVLLAACSSVVPKPFTDAELKTQADADLISAQQDVEPIKGPLTLNEAIARALKYNLDQRTRMMEEALAMNQLDLGNYDMLPKLIASAGYRDRDEYATTRAIDSVTGAPSLSNPFISSEKQHSLGDLGLTWNMLDFGLSYYSAKQNANRVLIATERRRKAMHNLIQDVRSAFWRAASEQKLRADVKQASAMAEAALVDARQAEKERLRSPLDALRYQRQVLENIRLLEGIEQELSTARMELSMLINAPQSTPLEVTEPAENLSKGILNLPVQQLENMALGQNADLREQNYNSRIAADETQKTILRLFPALSFNYDLRYDSDKYLVNNRWNEAGMQVSFNLFNILSARSQRRLADAGVALSDQRRIATQMAVVAQVHIARLQYANALQQFDRADAIWHVDDRINQQVANRVDAQTLSKLDMVANHTSAILSRLRRYQALALANGAASKLQATLGIEPQLGSVQELSLSQLQDQVGASLREWDEGKFTPTAAKSNDSHRE